MYENVWMGGAGTNDRFYDFDRPGDSYPSGGGQSHTLALWKAAAPAIDIIAPDIYHRSAVIYRTILSRYARRDNPLLIVETRRGLESARYCFMAIGEYSALGFAQFGVGIKGYGATADGEFGPQFADVAADFRLLAGMPHPSFWNCKGRRSCSPPSKRRTSPAVRSLSTAGMCWRCSLPPWPSNPVGPSPQDLPPSPRAACCFAQLQPDEFLILGFDTTIDFRPPVTSGHQGRQICTG